MHTQDDTTTTTPTAPFSLSLSLSLSLSRTLKEGIRASHRVLAKCRVEWGEYQISEIGGVVTGVWPVRCFLLNANPNNNECDRYIVLFARVSADRVTLTAPVR